MKKYFLLLSALCCGTLSLAQGDYSESHDNGFELGLKIGANATYIIVSDDLSNNKHFDREFTVKPLGGISAGINFNESSSIMLEAFYSRQGGKFDLTEGNKGEGKKIGEKEIELDYLVVPLLIKYTGLGETRFALQFGGQFAFLLRGTEENTFNQDVTVSNPNMPNDGQTIKAGKYLLATTDSDNGNIDVNTGIKTGKFNTTDINVVADIGLEHDLSDDTYLSFGLRLAYGFKDINDGEVDAHPRDLDKFTLRYNVTGGLHAGIHWIL